MLALHFVELYFEAAGARVFSVVVNGEEKISGLDMFAQAGVHIMIGSFCRKSDMEMQSTAAFAELLSRVSETSSLTQSSRA